MQKKNSNVIIKNVYKNGCNSTTKDKYLQVWISLINQKERSKGSKSVF